ncbi:hypothetical protein [Psychroserpens sp. S379A]|uniref:hypothetical protein n=1 Tax=Psychroserpens sp. S379A TaxID=3415137 RepID=UPI003C79EA66
MKYLFIILGLILISPNLQAQTKEEKERAKLEEQIEEKKVIYITNIIDGLEELDEFQKHILKQQLFSYYDELSKIYMLDAKTFEKEALINQLDSTHFKDFEEMLGREFIDKLLDKVKGKDKSDQKKKKKKKKKRKKKNKN